MYHKTSGWTGETKSRSELDTVTLTPVRSLWCLLNLVLSEYFQCIQFEYSIVPSEICDIRYCQQIVIDDDILFKSKDMTFD